MLYYKPETNRCLTPSLTKYEQYLLIFMVSGGRENFSGFLQPIGSV